MQTPTFFLEGIVREHDELSNFEGPLSLILMLLGKNKIEIRDIQISLILDQYLGFIAKMEAMDLEVASEFVQMASHLLYIKTAALLKADEQVSELELLIESLEQFRSRESYGRIKCVATVLGDAAERGLRVHVRGQEAQRAVPPYAYRHDGIELLKAMRAVFSRGAASFGSDAPRGIIPHKIVYNVREKSLEIIEWLRSSGLVRLREIFDRSASRSEIVATFISVLELCSSGSLVLSESEEGIVVSLSRDADPGAILDFPPDRQTEGED